MNLLSLTDFLFIPGRNQFKFRGGRYALVEVGYVWPNYQGQRKLVESRGSSGPTKGLSLDLRGEWDTGVGSLIVARNIFGRIYWRNLYCQRLGSDNLYYHKDDMTQLITFYSLIYSNNRVRAEIDYRRRFFPHFKWYLRNDYPKVGFGMCGRLYTLALEGKWLNLAVKSKKYPLEESSALSLEMGMNFSF